MEKNEPKNDYFKQWTDGIPYEIAFWNRIINNKKSRKSVFEYSGYLKEISFPCFDIQNFLLERENPILLDVGSALSYCGNLLSGKELSIVYVDPLAPYYNKILEKSKLNLPKIKFGMVEYLSSFFNQNTVDFILIQNALDHSFEPIKGILESLRVLSVGGVLYTKHHLNEAVTENYRGFHQYNIMIENSQLIIWNKKNKYNVNKLISDFATITTYIKDNEQIAVITKTKEVPTTLYNDIEDKKVLTKYILDIFETTSSFSYSLKYQIKLLYYNFVQFFMRFLSYKTKSKIKKVLAKIKQA